LKKILSLFILVCLIAVIVFLNLGRFVDITEPPLKSDIIVSLGGDEEGCRLKKALNLYKEGFSTSGKFIYTDVDYIDSRFSPTHSRKDYLELNGIPRKKIIHVDETMIYNTMEEVFFIKQYMQKNHYKTVIFVSHPQHSRRIDFMARHIANYGEAGLELRIVSCNPSWWDREHYYDTEVGYKVAIYETIKLFYNAFKYNPLLIGDTAYGQKLKTNEWEKAIKRLDFISENTDLPTVTSTK
jgi:hypothetical protein